MFSGCCFLRLKKNRFVSGYMPKKVWVSRYAFFVPCRNKFRKGDIEIPVSVRACVRPCVRPSQLCGRNSSETAQRISFKFCGIVSHHM